MSVTDEKTFVIRHVFNNVENMKENDIKNGHMEKHYGVYWNLRIHKYSRFYSSLDCLHPDKSTDWRIETSYSLKTVDGISIGPTKSHTYYSGSSSDSWAIWLTENAAKNYLISGDLEIEYTVRINEMTGIKKKKLRNFDDDSAKEHSDVVLKIGDQNFHVNKAYLSLHSSYFKSLFTGNFSESQKPEIELKEIDPENLQSFLEVIYGEPAIDENCFTEILKLADFFDSKTAIRRCEEFIMGKSVGALKSTFQLAMKYKMDQLKKKCIYEMETSDDFQSIVPEDANDIDNETWKELFLKATSYF